MPLDYLDLLPSGGSQAHAEIPTALQSNIEKAADALIKDETNKIAKVIIRLFLIGNRRWYCVLRTTIIRRTTKLIKKYPEIMNTLSFPFADSLS